VAGLSRSPEGMTPYLRRLGVLIDGAKHFRAARMRCGYRAAAGRGDHQRSRPARSAAPVEHLGFPAVAMTICLGGELTLREIVGVTARPASLGPKRDIGLFESAGRQLGAPVRLSARATRLRRLHRTDRRDHETPEIMIRLEELPGAIS